MGWQLWIAAALVVDALDVAGQALVAKHQGDDAPDRAREEGDRLLTLGVVTGLALSVGLAALTPVLPLGWGLPGVWLALIGVNVVRCGALAWGYAGWPRAAST